MSLLKRFPSYRYVIDAAGSAFARFPLALVSAVFGTMVAVNLVDRENVINEHLQEKLGMIALLGIPLFISLSVLSEKQKWGRGLSIAAQLVGVAALAGYFFLLPVNAYESLIHPVRFLLLSIGLHFLVSFIPYLGKDQSEGFWQYNVAMFLRFLTSALYSAVMYLGLTIALAAADHLFGFDVKEIRYFQLWIIIAGTFSVWVFLAGVPKGLTSMNHPREYPKGLKLFTQFILLPLVALYFIILITYEAKIIIEWNWPKGWVSQLVLWYSVVGILSLLLLHPLRKQAENRWVQVFTKWFFRALVPLVLMLFLAIAQRISDYGITENRYFVLAMAVGLSVVVLYFIVSKAKDIRVIPIVICILAFASAFGPLSAFSVSKSSQQARLDAMLAEAGLFANGSLQETPKESSFEIRQEMSSIVGYLNEWHGIEPFGLWLPDSSLAVLDTVNSHTRDGKITRMLGFKFVSGFHTQPTNEYFHLAAADDHSFSISGQELLIFIGSAVSLDSGATYGSGEMACVVGYDDVTSEILMSFTDDHDTLRFGLSGLPDSLADGQSYTTIPAGQLTFDLLSERHEGQIFFQEISGSYDSVNCLSVSGIEATIVLGRR